MIVSPARPATLRQPAPNHERQDNAMTTPAKLIANRANARESTGPTTDAGKAVARLNAVSHGLRSAVPVIPGEDVAEWDAFRDGMAAALAPVGALEDELAGRAALLLWRLRRVIRFEAGTTAAATERAVGRALGDGEGDNHLQALLNPGGGAGAPRTVAGRRKELAGKRARLVTVEADAGVFRDLAERPDDHPLPGEVVCRVLADVADAEAMPAAIDNRLWDKVGVPREWWDNPGGWDGWTLGHLKAGFARLAAWRGGKPGPLVDLSDRRRAREAVELRREIPRLEAGLAQAEAEAAGAVAGAVARAAVPDAETVDRLTRYEAHLHRQLVQTLHLLERVQAARAGCPVPPAAALDVTVESAGPAGAAG